MVAGCYPRPGGGVRVKDLGELRHRRLRAGPNCGVAAGRRLGAGLRLLHRRLRHRDRVAQQKLRAILRARAPGPVAACGDEHQRQNSDDQAKLALVLAQARRRAAQNMGKFVLFEAMTLGGFHQPALYSLSLLPQLFPSALPPRQDATRKH